MPIKNTETQGAKPPPSLLQLPQSSTPRPPTAGAQGFGVGGMRRPTPSLSAPAPSDDARYVVYLRLPFPRNGFIDPPPVDWDSTKERTLWKVISRSARNSELDWNDLAEKFNVSVPFLLQQAAWLYERELSQVRAQLRRVGNTALGGAATPTSPTASPNLRDMRTVSTSAVKTTAVPMSPSPSRQGNLVPASAPTTRVPSTAPPMSRTTSTATARPVPSQNPLLPINTLFTAMNPPPQAQTPVPQNQQPPSASPLTQQRQISTDILSQSRLYQPSSTLRRSVSTKSTSSTSSETSSTDNENRILPKRRVFKRTDLDSSNSALENNKEEDENPAFLFWNETDKAAEEDNDSSTVVTGGVTRRERPGSRPIGGYESDRDKNTSAGTIRRGFSQQQQQQQPQQQQQFQQQQQLLLQQQGQGQGQGQGQQQPSSRNIGNPDSDSSNPGSVSNPRRKTNGEGKRVGGHESSPSMGSSFSDLSDASVSQSALEEQYMSAMGGGGLASRMSTLTNFNPRSRYF